MRARRKSWPRVLPRRKRELNEGAREGGREGGSVRRERIEKTERGREGRTYVPVLVHRAPGTHTGGVDRDGFESPAVVVGQRRREGGREGSKDVPVLIDGAPGTHTGSVDGDSLEGPAVVISQCLGTHDQDAAEGGCGREGRREGGREGRCEC